MQTTLSNLWTKKQKGEEGKAVGVQKEEADSAPATEVIAPTPTAPSLEKGLFELLQDPGWRGVLEAEWSQPHMRQLEAAVEAEYSRARVYPPRPLLFNALNQTPLAAVRLVILGQDPYHGPGQAMGLSFSVPRGVAIPSSLRNIYKEIQTEIPTWKAPKHGDLSAWAQRGVLLLNTGLTVRDGEANSHSKLGWHLLTDRIMRILSEQQQPMVFLLWGKHAQDRGKVMRANPSHLVLKSAHPSGLSASKGFFGNGHFIKARDFLNQKGCDFSWDLPL